MISQEQEIHHNRLSEIIKESESVTNDFRVKINNQLSTFTNNFIEQQEKMDTFQLNMSSLVNKVQDLETSESKQNSLLSKLGEQGDNIESKLSSLESADLFLQEAHRMHTEKALDIEKECKRMEQTFIQFYKDQRQEIDSKIKVDISNLQLEEKSSKEIIENINKRVGSTEVRLMEIEQYTQNSNETIVLNMQENMERLEKSSNDRATDLENTVIKYYEQIGANSNNIKEINNMTTDLRNKLQNLNDIVEENKITQNKFEKDQDEINKDIIQQLKAEGEKFYKMESDVNHSIQNLSKQYSEVDEKLVMTINEKFENLQSIIGNYENKNKDTIQYMQDLTERTSNLEQNLENKYSVLDERNKEYVIRLNSLQESNNLQNQKVGNVEGLSDKVNHIEDTMKSYAENFNSMKSSINKYETRGRKLMTV
eukprot:TRINITY_DN12751_c0_g1_i1.p1 TRINITY_DN12751_c0_g1~~TRINITY_DN12751_c0_g1_i1.p1  ORF type:complete len:425 (-),score=94.58 TRINITY_DN12751_c0_g1_i1:727-2001(-)